MSPPNPGLQIQTLEWRQTSRLCCLSLLSLSLTAADIISLYLSKPIDDVDSEAKMWKATQKVY